MGTAFSLALRDSLGPVGRRALMLSLGGALVLLTCLWLGAWALLGLIHVSRFPWIDTPIEILGNIAALVIAWLVFPAMSMLVLSLFLDRVVAAIERAHYPGLPPARAAGLGEAIKSGARLALLGLVLNIAALPLYLFLPGINFLVFYALNGYLVGREYFEQVALRRLEPPRARAMWHRYRNRLILAGAIVSFFLSIPFVNLAAPLIGVAFMLHLFEDLRRRTEILVGA
jgi:CysZ protein